VIPFIQEALDDQEIGGQTIVTSQSLPSLRWLEPGTIGDALGRPGGGGGGGGARGEPAPGLHGHGLDSVQVGDLTLQPGEVANRIPAGADITFDVSFTNQGEHDERDVAVRVRIRGAGEPITVSKRVDQTTAGQQAEVSVPLGQAPPIGTPVTIEVEVAGVPGEEKLDNNTSSYTAIFTR
jgi:hypothetical protein